MKAGIRLTIPDGDPRFQLKMITEYVEVMRSFAKVTGEDIEADLKPLVDAANKILKDIAEGRY
jgi:hypothetical protein